MLLEAFALAQELLADYHLVFIGPDGGMRQDLDNKTVAKDLTGRIHFLGYLGGAEKSQAYHAADLLVIPSRQEAMSIVALEAGICGTPVLLTDQCGFDEVKEMQGGLVAPASVQGMYKGLMELCRSPEILTTMGARLKANVLTNYTWDAAAKKYIHLYRQILKGGQAV